MMKKFTPSLFALICVSIASKAQTQKDWYLIGSDLANIGLNFQKGNTAFSFLASPKVAWFVKDNLAVGAQVDLGLATNTAQTTFIYGVGPLARYYFQGNGLNSVSKTRWFGELNVGISGQNTKVKGGSNISTNGFGLGFGPGLAYFINQNIALEALAKYNFTSGFGNSTNSNALNIGLGFQIHLPKAKVKSLKNDVK